MGCAKFGTLRAAPRREISSGAMRRAMRRMEKKTRPKPHRSERQYEWTRNYALILSYRSPVAVVPIGISGVRAG